MTVEIASRQNLIYKELKRISKGDDKYIFIEGAKLLEEVLTSPVKIKNIYLDKRNKSLLSKLSCKNWNQNLCFIKNELISSLYTTDTKPTAQALLLAIAHRPKYEISDLFKTKKVLVLLENIQDPGNLGVIIRSSLAFNSGGVILMPPSVDPFNTKVIRSSAGAVFKLPFVFINDFNSVWGLAKENSYNVVATSSHATEPLSSLKSNRPCLFMFGNEGSGLSKQLIKKANDCIVLPSTSEVESLNLATSVSIVLWENYKNSEMGDAAFGEPCSPSFISERGR